MITKGHVHVKRVWGVPQFWLVWLVLCLNVTAGIGILGMASPLLQEVFGGGLINKPELGFAQLDKDQLAAIAAIAAGFTGLLSLFNIGGRFFWASLSDKLGRKTTYLIFLVLGFVLYSAIPWTAHIGALALFVAAFCVILSMYGGGFATVPAYLADLFGTQMVGRHPRPPADGMVGGGHLRPRAGELHPRIPAVDRRAARAGLRHHHVHPGRACWSWASCATWRSGR